MAGARDDTDISFMIYAQIVLMEFTDQVSRSITIELHEGYGPTAAIAHDIASICVFSAEFPVLLSVNREPLHLVRKDVRELRVWADRSGGRDTG